MEMYRKHLFNIWNSYGESSDESSSREEHPILLYDNVNNFIPRNEIGLGCMLLNPDGTPKAYC